MTKLESLQIALLEWYAHAQRKLPWRVTPSLYGTVVSEFMLQQTQVSTVLPYFERWMTTFPSFDSLAQADEAAVLKSWEGLGYYSRARNLQRLARRVVNEGIPDNYDNWLALPGVGPYTAAAITSIAQNLPHAVVDGNVVRVLTRLKAMDTEFSGNAAAVAAISPLANDLLAKDRPGDFNQALMELGATICTKGQPSCVICPWRSYCKAAKRGDPANFPKIHRRPTVSRSLQRIWLLTEAGLLLQRIPDSSKRLAGHYELPQADVCQSFAVLEPIPLLTKKRGIANESITEAIHSGKIRSSKAMREVLTSDSHLKWIPLQQIDRTQLSGPHRRWIKQLLT